MRKDEEEWDHEGFRRFVMSKAASAGFDRASELARAAGIRDGMLSKWLNGREQPSIDSLRKLADPLRVKVIDLAILAGRMDPGEIQPGGEPAPRPRAEMHALAVELGRMLAEDSPLAADQRERLAIVVDHSMDPYRGQMKRRRSSGPAA